MYSGHMDKIGFIVHYIGAQTAAFNLSPHTAIAVDMGVAMDYPRSRPEEQG